MTDPGFLKCGGSRPKGDVNLIWPNFPKKLMEMKKTASPNSPPNPPMHWKKVHEQAQKVLPFPFTDDGFRSVTFYFQGSVCIRRRHAGSGAPLVRWSHLVFTQTA